METSESMMTNGYKRVSLHTKYLTGRHCFKILSFTLFISIVLFMLASSPKRLVIIVEPPSSTPATTDNLAKVSSPVTVIPKIESSEAADALPRNGLVFCWVLTSPKYFDSRVPAVNETWLKRCDHGQFFTTEPVNDTTIPFTTVFSGLNDSYAALFHKTQAGFNFAYTEISDEFDWYMKADDDSFVIMENLKDYLSQFDPKKPYYFGYVFKPFLKNGYNSGGAGYVLSNAALKIFVEEVHGNTTLCPFNDSEDVGLARCLESKGIYPTDTRNKNEQHRFSPYSMEEIFNTKEDNPVYTKWPEKRKYEAFAPELITFHHQTPAELRMIEILLYKINDPRLSKFYKG